ncbi:hypothetical protein C8R46DRAFT_1296421 [Mycena filopes]|nr:hypothetical protein C8R46DRAFT_1296421 [Mycena filopes]
MSTLLKYAAVVGSQWRLHQPSYAQALRVDNGIMAEPQQDFSMAALNEGSVALPRNQHQVTAPGIFAMTSAGAAAALPIGAERRAVIFEGNCHPSAHRAMVPYHADRATGPLDDTSHLAADYTLPVRRPRLLEDVNSSEDYASTVYLPNDDALTLFYPYATSLATPQSPRYTTSAHTSQWSSAQAWHPKPQPSASPSPLAYSSIRTAPSPAPVFHRQEPRRPRYYGPFEACSREDVLPEFHDVSADVRVEEPQQRELDRNDWIVDLLSVVEREATTAPPSKPDGMSEDDWQFALEVRRHRNAVQRRILSGYKRNREARSEGPTGLLGLPVVVQVKAVHPDMVWKETLADLETKSESGRY